MLLSHRRSEAYGQIMDGVERDSIAANRAYWGRLDDKQIGFASNQWRKSQPTWGVFGIPEEKARLLPERAEGLRVVELGCGTAYVSAWLARKGAKCIGVDPTARQLEIAADMQDQIGPRFPLVQAPGEAVPIAGGSADFVISEYGAAIWADPYSWIPEAARLLRPGGELVFLGNSSLIMLCVPDLDGQPAEDRMVRPQKSMHRFTWPDDPSVEFHLSHGDWIALFIATDLEVMDLIELYVPPGAETRHVFVTSEWASRWPCEEVWRVRKR
jgi:SAM-dependent methyltransferase